MMNSGFPLISAFLAGLLGSVHCIAMCGGIVGSLSLGLAEEIRQRRAALLPYLLTYNLGRLLSYALAGLLAGVLGTQLMALLPLQDPGVVVVWISGIFLIALGLYIGAWWQALAWLEKAGARVWRYIEPWGRGLLPVRSPWQALALGLVWGWLPCGLVYSMLVLAFTAGSGVQGVAIMLAFGFGTLPMLLAMGGAAQWLHSVTREPALRRIAGALIITAGLFTLSRLMTDAPAYVG